MDDRNDKHDVPEQELRNALSAAEKALHDMGLERGLSPDAERARDLCRETLEKMNTQRQPHNRRDILFEEGYRWTFEKADLEQGAYSLTDSELSKVAVIFPDDKNHQIDHPNNNASLRIRNYDSEDWLHKGVFSFEEATALGDIHADRYRQNRVSFHSLVENLKDEPQDQEKDRSR